MSSTSSNKKRKSGDEGPPSGKNTNEELEKQLLETKKKLVAAEDRAKQAEERVKKAEERAEQQRHAGEERPWGRFDSIDRGAHHQVKRISVKPGGQLSLQYHHHRSEHWVVVQGTALITIGDIEKLVRVVKLTGFVNSTPDFTDQPKVVNGCSELFRELWGSENGVGARAAVGMASLPAGAVCEIEAIFELHPQR